MLLLYEKENAINLFYSIFFFIRTKADINSIEHFKVCVFVRVRILQSKFCALLFLYYRKLEELFYNIKKKSFLFF